MKDHEKTRNLSNELMENPFMKQEEENSLSTNESTEPKLNHYTNESLPLNHT